MTVSHPYEPDEWLPDRCVARPGSLTSVACGRPAADHVVAGPPTPPWWTAPTPPDWVLEHLPAVTGWRNAGERRWRGELVDNVYTPVLLLLVNTAGTGFVRNSIPDDLGDHEAEEFAVAFEAMQEHLDHEALPECVAPGCTDKGAMRFVAAELGHLAGRVYAAGDEIRMCVSHGHDVMRAGEGLDQIAAWLRPDAAVLDPHAVVVSHYDRLSAEQSRQKYGRLPRLLVGSEETR